MLLDSNIIIYSAKSGHAELRDFLNLNLYSVSVVSRIEVLGYHLLTEQKREYLEKFFEAASVLPISDLVVTQAVHLRQIRRMSLGDAIVAGTALTYKLELVTRNVRDFSWIQGLMITNPLESLS
jgi:predicted nucleic acid-binding protein